MLFELDDAGVPALVPPETPLPQGAYTTLRTYHGRRVLRLEQHIARLTRSVELQGSPAALHETRLRAGLAAVLARAGFDDTRLRVTFAPPRLFIAAARFEPLPHELYEAGVACATVPLRRDNPHAKDTRFLATAEAARARLPEKTHEGLLVDDAGDAPCILEGLSSNFFGVIDGALRTEGARVLEGVTRSIVLELAAPLAEVRMQAVRRDELPRLGEAFITSVSRGVLPVVCIDGRAVADGRPGPLTRALVARLFELVEREARDIMA